MTRFADKAFEARNIYNAFNRTGEFYYSENPANVLNNPIREFFLVEQPAVILADNVASYYHQVHFKEQQKLKGISELPTPYPAFNSLWMEFKKGNGQFLGFSTCVVGWEDLAMLLVSANRKQEFEEFVQYVTGRGHTTSAQDEILAGNIYVYDVDEQWITCGATVKAAYDKDKNIIGTCELEIAITGLQVRDDIEDYFFDATYVFFLSLSLMNCRNVSLIERNPKNNREAKRYLQRNGRPMMKHYILNIEPMKNTLQTEGNISENGIKKALHICRGHFRTYDETKRLFGKYTGTYWIPNHVRGSAEKGEVRKWYAVK